MSTLKRTKAALVFIALLSMICAGPVALAAPPQGSAQQAVGIVALRHATEGAQTRIILEGTAELPYTIYKPDEQTILVDLPGVDAAGLEESYAVGSRGVERIQVERLRTASGQSLARLRLRLGGPVEDRTVIEGKNLILTLISSVAASRPAEPAAQESTPASSLRAETPVQKPAVKTVAAPVRVASAPVPANPATVISGVRTEVENGTFRAFIATDGRVAFKHFVLPNPDRIVIDVTGVRSGVDRSAVEVNTGGVSRIRVGQFRTADPRIVRIVFDIDKVGQYDVKQSGNELVVTLGSDSGSAVAARKTAKPAETAPKPAPRVDPPAATVEPRRVPPAPVVASDADDSPTEVKAQPPASKPAASPAVQQPEPARKPAAAPVQTVSDEPQQRTSGRTGAERPASTRPATTSQSTAAPRTSQRQAVPPAPAMPTQSQQDGYLNEGFVGRPVNLELKNVDLRDILRFLHNQYNVNFIVDKSVPASVPIDVSVKGVPWNQALDAILKAQGLGATREGQIVRIAAVASLAEERQAQLRVQEAIFSTLPLVTKIYRLKYASPFVRSGATGGSQDLASAGSGGGFGGAGGGFGGGGGIGGGNSAGILAIIQNRLSSRGRVEIDIRTNSLIVTDLAQRLDVVEQIIRALDRPEPQVEIEARIVIARRQFLRDLGVQLSAGVANPSRGGFAGISTIPGVQRTTGGGGGDTGGGTNTSLDAGIPILPGVTPSFPSGLLGGPAVQDGTTIISLTTGLIGTAQISAVIIAAERRGQIRTISAPRVTTQNNTTAEVVNGVQIPVQTVTNNTITTTFVDAALKLQITPQIIIEDGAVLLSVLAENNSVSALRTVGGTPGIDSQRATAVVLVPDGGTTVIGGINIDTESQAEDRTPGLARIPIFGNLFKRKQANRDTQEILFFITPRIFRPELVGLSTETTLRSSDITIAPSIPAGSDGVTTITPVTTNGGGGGDQ
jgi:type IV pilus assembly protein PilQ